MKRYSTLSNGQTSKRYTKSSHHLLHEANHTSDINKGKNYARSLNSKGNVRLPANSLYIFGVRTMQASKIEPGEKGTVEIKSEMRDIDLTETVIFTEILY